MKTRVKTLVKTVVETVGIGLLILAVAGAPSAVVAVRQTASRSTQSASGQTADIAGVAIRGLGV